MAAQRLGVPANNSRCRRWVVPWPVGLMPWLLLGGALSRASAQSVTSGTLRLEVREVAGTPVSDASIALRIGRDGERTARTDSAGIARLIDLPPGLHALSVRRLGLAPVQRQLRIAAGDNAYTVRVTASALALEGVRIVGGEPVPARLDDFERRRLQGLPNAVVTRDAIDRVGPVQFSRLLRGMGGLRIADSLGSTIAVSTRGGKPTPLPPGRGTGFAVVQCVLRVVLDGVLLPPLSNLDAIVPREVHGVEVYYGPARLPPELAGLRTDNWCGVIAVWTRSG